MKMFRENSELFDMFKTANDVALFLAGFLADDSFDMSSSTRMNPRVADIQGDEFLLRPLSRSEKFELLCKKLDKCKVIVEGSGGFTPIAARESFNRRAPKVQRRSTG